MKQKKFLNTLTMMIIDAIIISSSYILSMLIAETIGYGDGFPKIGLFLVIIIAVKIIIYLLLGIYNTITRYLDYTDITKIVLATFFTNVVIVIYLTIPGITKFMPRSIYLFITTLEIVGLVLVRMFRRFIEYRKKRSSFKKLEAKRTLIIGAGSAAELAIKEINNNKNLNNYIVGLVDDDPIKLGRTISNIKVLGTISDLKDIIPKCEVEEIVMAINNYPKTKFNDLLNEISEFDDLIMKRISLSGDLRKEQDLKIVDVKPEDLLDRYEIKLEAEDINNFIKDEVVLVTGGGGSIGSELSRQIFNLNPKELIIFDIYENNAYDIQMELERLRFKRNIDVKLTVLIGSVYNTKRLEQVYETYKPTLVFHAAAYKHVPLMEDSPMEAIRTNVLGTKNSARLANKYGVKKFVLVSSDKAVRPTNIMGATKRYAEMIVAHYNEIGPTKFSSVRFGNVLGSNGSVIPLFKKQIADGGPVTVTHKDITRYFMTIPEAVGLILQSATYANGGEVFVLDMGNPVKIYDLAYKMIRLSGLRPGIDIDIVITGLRPGEKLYEELLVDHNNNTHLKTEHSRIFIEKQNGISYDSLDFKYVEEHFENLDNEHIKKMVAKVIDTYDINGNGK
ncbi:MAG TPA: polysaccharide biosynthesis protein [Acholeplasma sp.]|nr:polysaccharide biosynthesis protein [Acholeplasma sp.]